MRGAERGPRHEETPRREEEKREGSQERHAGDAEHFAAEASRERIVQAEVGAERRQAKENIATQCYRESQRCVESAIAAGQTAEHCRFLEHFCEMDDEALATESLRKTRRAALTALESKVDNDKI